MSLDEAALRDALERSQPTRNHQLIETLVSEPSSVKRSSSICDRCEDRPCQDGELCATLLVNELDVLSSVGRDQAFHYVEGGMQRLQLARGAELRETGEHRPNTFVALASDATASTDPTASTASTASTDPTDATDPDQGPDSGSNPRSDS